MTPDIFPDGVPPPAEGETLPLIHFSRLQTHPHDNSAVFIHDDDLDQCGYEKPRVGSILHVKGQGGADIYFEIAARAGKKRPGWFLQRVPDAAEMFADLPVLDAEPEA